MQETVERLRTQCSLADPAAEEFENILAYLYRYGFRGQGSGCGRCFLIGIQEVDTVGTDAEMSLEISLDSSTQRIV
jgi:hypothetical protein